MHFLSTFVQVVWLATHVVVFLLTHKGCDTVESKFLSFLTLGGE